MPESAVVEGGIAPAGDNSDQGSGVIVARGDWSVTESNTLAVAGREMRTWYGLDPQLGAGTPAATVRQGRSGVPTGYE